MNVNFISRHIELWPTDRLIPYARNARQHSAEQIGQIAASVREFGFTNPILVDSAAGIVAGHARLAAACTLSLAEVPVIVLDHVTPAQKRAYVLADSKLAENASWDETQLRLELAELAAAEYDLSLTGFSDPDIDQLLREMEYPVLTDEDTAPAADPDEVSRQRDLWILGPHRVLCGDAAECTSYEQVLAGQHADMVFTDPPYNVDYGTDSRKIANDNLGDRFDSFLRVVCGHLLTSCEGAVYICMSSSELATLQRAFTEAGGHWSTFIIWAKNTFTLGRSDYQRQYEPILYGWRKGARHYPEIRS